MVEKHLKNDIYTCTSHKTLFKVYAVFELLLKSIVYTFEVSSIFGVPEFTNMAFYNPNPAICSKERINVNKCILLFKPSWLLLFKNYIEVKKGRRYLFWFWKTK